MIDIFLSNIFVLFEWIDPTHEVILNYGHSILPNDSEENATLR
jgi:hypothetical protein